jgi:hypothetical protein
MSLLFIAREAVRSRQSNLGVLTLLATVSIAKASAIPTGYAEKEAATLPP